MSERGVDVVLTAYNEAPHAIAATLDAIARQSHRAESVRLVDDASPVPVADVISVREGVEVIRLDRNAGIAAARNRGIAAGRAPFVACINIDVLPEARYLEACANYLVAHSDVALLSVRLDLSDAATPHGRWRRLVQEPRYPKTTGPVGWAAGHALFLRRTALEQVGGFDTARRLAGEDVDLCFRLRRAGFGVHFIGEVRCRSIQSDTVDTFGRAEYNRSCVRGAAPEPFLRSAGILAARSAQRLAIQVIRRDLRLVPVELGVLRAALGEAWRRRSREGRRRSTSVG
jgi:glycosyltransferase involved in cell wall biosynthesis